ncbi:MAG: MFS transporter [Candidatus Ozemobacteraceae bacterium]
MELSQVSQPPGFKSLVAFFFCQKSLNTLLILSFSSLFLEKFGAAGWPWFLIGFPVLFVTTQFAILSRSDWKGHLFLERFTVPLAVVSIGFAFLGENQSGWLVFAGLVLSRTYDLHSNQAFFDMSGQILSLRASKRYLPAIMAFGNIGSILAGLLLTFILPQIGFGNLFLLVAVLSLITHRLLPGIAEQIAHGQSAPLPPSGTTTTNTDWQNILPASKTYILSIIAISVMGGFVFNMAEFQCNGNLPRFYPNAAELAAFLGLFYAAIDLTVLVVQGIAGGWIFSRLPLSWIIRIRPIVMCGTCGIAFLVPCLVTIVGTQFAVRTLTFIFMAPVWVLLLEPLPQTSRLFARRLLNIADCLTSMVVGLGLLAWKNWGGGPDPILFLVISALAGLTLIGNRFVIEWYPRMIQDTLSSASLRESEDGIVGFRFLTPADRWRHIQIMATDARTEIRRGAIVEMSKNIDDRAWELLLSLIPKELSTTNLPILVQTIVNCREKNGTAVLRDFLNEVKEPRTLSDFLEALGENRHTENIPIFLVFLQHSHHRVRGSAVLGILRQGLEKVDIEKGLDSLYSETTSQKSIERSTAAAVLGKLGLPAFIPALIQLSQDNDVNVAESAFRSLAAIRTPGILEFLASQIPMSGFRGKLASEAWERASNQDQEILSRLIGGMTEAERRKTGFWFQALRSGGSPTFLIRLMKLDNPDVRAGIMELLADRDLDCLQIATTCLREEGGKIYLDPAPLLTQLSSIRLQQISSIVELVPFICGPHHEAYEALIIKWMKRLSWEFVILYRSKKLSICTSERETALRNILETRRQGLLRLIALSGDNPGSLFDALRKACHADSFLTSVAIEFLETNLSRSICSLLIPLIEFDRNPEQICKTPYDADLPEPFSVTPQEIDEILEDLEKSS